MAPFLRRKGGGKPIFISRLLRSLSCALAWRPASTKFARNKGGHAGRVRLPVVPATLAAANFVDYLPPHKFVQEALKNAVIYVDADPTICQCLYVGNQAATRFTLARNVFQKKLADEQAFTAQVNQRGGRGVWIEGPEADAWRVVEAADGGVNPGGSMKPEILDFGVHWRRPSRSAQRPTGSRVGHSLRGVARCSRRCARWNLSMSLRTARRPTPTSCRPSRGGSQRPGRHQQPRRRRNLRDLGGQAWGEQRR